MQVGSCEDRGAGAVLAGKILGEAIAPGCEGKERWSGGSVPRMFF